MRIIAGRLRGRRIEGPKGAPIRPTGERAREAVFDILTHGGFDDRNVCEDARVLDAFAGTGAMGLEALSRGARFATFLEKDRAARLTLQRLVAAWGEQARTAIVSADATNPPRAAGPCDLVFLDPPYGEAIAAAALAALGAAGWLASGALCVVETSSRGSAFAAPPGFERLDERSYGAARIAFLRAPAKG